MFFLWPLVVNRIQSVEIGWKDMLNIRLENQLYINKLFAICT